MQETLGDCFRDIVAVYIPAKVKSVMPKAKR